MTKRERMPRTSTSEGAWLDANLDRRADPDGNRAQRRKAAKGRRQAQVDPGIVNKPN